MEPLDQQEGATAHAEAEAARRDIKAALASGELTLAGVFEAADAEPNGESHRVVGHMHIRSALLALPNVGTVRADHLLEEAGLAGDRHIASLGSQQREKLLELVASL